MKYNKHQSILFQQECIRNRLPRSFADEYLIFLTTLYGRRFESGEVRLQDYHDMTMFDIHNEIVLRTKMIRADNDRKKKQQEEKERKEQEQAINELLILQR